MNNRYVGDINDYRKYGLLRLLTRSHSMKHAVCWMRTPDERHSERSSRISYLHYPLIWSPYDPELFDCLRDIVVKRKIRNVSAIEKSGILGEGIFFSECIPDDIRGRARYFKSFMDRAQLADLLFFDPDNGIEVPSMPCGWKGSSKYLYWRELITAYTSGHSVLIYQHFPRITRQGFIASIADRLVRETGSPVVYSFRTTHVLFLLICFADHSDAIQQVIPEIEKKWEPQFGICRHEGKG